MPRNIKHPEMDEFAWRRFHEEFVKCIEAGDFSPLVINGKPRSIHREMLEVLTKQQQSVIAKQEWETIFSFGLYVDDYDMVKKGGDIYTYLGCIVDTILDYIPKPDQNNKANGDLIFTLRNALFHNQKIYYGDKYCIEIIYDRDPLFVDEGMCAVLIEKCIGGEHIFPDEQNQLKTK